MTLKIFKIFILFLLFTNSASFSQTAVRSGSINDCATWNATGNFFLGATANNGGHTITATESDRTITSMALGSGSSVLSLQGANTVNLNTTGSFLTCPIPASEGPVYYGPFRPSSASCYYGSVSAENGCTFYTWNTTNTWTVTESAYYKMDTKVNIQDNRGDCCWLSDFDLTFEVKARNSSGNSRYLYGRTSDLYTGSWQNSCWGASVEYTTISNTGNLVYLNKGELIHVDVSIRNCQNGWTSGSMPIEIESTYYFDHY